jgi:hypothetical protein
MIAPEQPEREEEHDDGTQSDQVPRAPAPLADVVDVTSPLSSADPDPDGQVEDAEGQAREQPIAPSRPRLPRGAALGAWTKIGCATRSGGDPGARRRLGDRLARAT